MSCGEPTVDAVIESVRRDPLAMALVGKEATVRIRFRRGQASEAEVAAVEAEVRCEIEALVDRHVDMLWTPDGGAP